MQTVMTKTIPSFDIENENPGMIIAGVDEAGRGPLCGPVVAGAVIFSSEFRVKNSGLPVLVTDSKQMTKAQREAAYEWIVQNTIWATGSCSPEEIDDINILQASLLAMKRAVSALLQKPDFVLVDGNRMPDGIIGKAVVKGDAKSLSIAAASIVAKVTRDRIMTDLAKEFPEYGWDKNAGYPTASHIDAIKKYGINEHYRKTFGPVRDIGN